MNWGSLKAKVLSRIHDTSLADKVPDWFNEVQLEMVGLAQWRHLEQTKILPTTAPQSTGTASATRGLTTVTFAGTTVTAAVAGQLINIGGSYYKIASFTNTTTIELDSAFIGTTGSGMAYQIVFYALTPPTDFSTPRLLEATIQSGSGVMPLQYATEHDLFETWSNEVDTLGPPTILRFFAGKIVLWPPPNGAYNIELFYHRVPAEVSTTSVDATVIDWPDDMQYPILQGVFAVGFEHIDDTLTASCRGRFEKGMIDAIARNNRAPMGGAGKFKRWDNPRMGGGLPYRLPEPV